MESLRERERERGSLREREREREDDRKRLPSVSSHISLCPIKILCI